MVIAKTTSLSESKKASENSGLSELAGRDIISSIISGNEYAQSFSQNSQYRAGGISSCGLAALNCVRVAFQKEQDGQDNVLEALLSADTTNEILMVSDMWSGSSHLEVDELLQLPLFTRNLELIETQYSEVSVRQLLPLLQELENHQGITAAVITRPPEIIVCLKVPIHQTGRETKPSIVRRRAPQPPSSVFVIFDSHPRPSHPNGAGWVFNTSSRATAHQLHQILAVDHQIFNDPDMQWQAQLLNNFSGHILIPHEQQGPSALDDPEVQRLVWDTSFRILNLQAELADVKEQNKKYADEQEELRRSRSAAQRKAEELEKSNELLSRKLKSVGRRDSLPEAPSSAYTAALSRQQGRAGSDDPGTSSPFSLSRWRGKQRESSSDFPPLTQREVPEAGSNSGWSQKKRDLSPDFPGLTQRELQQQHDYMRAIQEQRPSSPWGRNERNPKPDFPVLTQRELQEQHDYMKALQEQRKFEEESRRLEKERRDLAAFAQVTFTCGICFDVLPEEDLALIERCSHKFCRECLQGYTLSKIHDRRFPIVCPTCMSDSKAHPDPGIVEQNLVEQMNIPQKDYQVLEEMMLSQYCIPLHCSQCSRTSFVDREEYQEENKVACPLPGCTHAWCKHCNQSINNGGPEHSCDGTNELAALMQEKGWKTCPGCKTNILKTDGCNHMTCPSPGCNMHFCYLCGGSIVQSALPREISNAIGAHYRVCRLFEEVPDRGVPP